MSTPEKPHRMTDREIFLNAPENSSPDELKDYLDRMCGEDVELRVKVEALLTAHGRAGSRSPGQPQGPRDEETVRVEATLEDPGRPQGERFPPGTTLADRYRIVSLLGRGGMGEVYRADDLTLGLPVALKFLPPDLSGNPAVLEALFNEVRQARLVSHRHVCRVHDVGMADGQHFLTMALIEGENLGGLLRQIGRLPRDKALALGRQLCAGLGAAHEQGLLHLDLKPGNLMIDSDGDLLITDFGLARLAEEAAKEKRRAGTPAYMAPEQMSSGEGTPPCDLYSVGLILYEMSTGRM
ncbi:MAG: serine/threonine protein kinase, partial [Akkermansiaceae bacterium]|nr:serine/threonine protein kinase [Akkermansiaceae bacterium]